MFMFAIIILLDTVDCISTRYAIGNSLGHEVNPFLIDIVNTNSFLLLKPTLITFTLFAIYKTSNIFHDDNLTFFAATELIILYALVCINNIMVLFLGVDLSLSFAKLILITLISLALVLLVMKVYHSCFSPSSPSH
ncbi:MAG: membrane protein [Candidatus Syntrophoarchaeum caldarius]|nr:MAG: membrane protein [Candidatus Syntrophoarchaeum caldarius]